MSHELSLTAAGLVLVAAVLAAFPALGVCGTADVIACWTEAQMSIDGQAVDWDGIPTTYLDDEGAVVGMCSDSGQVYVLFRIRDARSALHIRRSGLTVWLNADGKKKKEFGVRYFGGPQLSEIRELLGAGEDGQRPDMPPERIARMEEMSLGTGELCRVIYRAKEQPDTIPTDGSRGPAVGYAPGNGLFTYELAVPLQASDYAIFGMGAQPGQKICLGVEWGGRPGRAGGGIDGQGMGRGGPGGRIGGGRGGGRPGRGRMQPFEKHEIWFETELANRPEE
jgi:hypothetical protein